MVSQPAAKPAIHVYIQAQLQKSPCIDQLLLGMEEEGVPYFLERGQDGSALELGYRAAETSSLGVGVGIGEDGNVVLHYSKLKPEKPIRQMNLFKEAAKLRAIGSNAARLVKRVPFKSWEEAEAEGHQPTAEMSGEDIALIVAEVLKRIRQIE